MKRLFGMGCVGLVLSACSGEVAGDEAVDEDNAAAKQILANVVGVAIGPKEGGTAPRCLVTYVAPRKFVGPASCYEPNTVNLVRLYGDCTRGNCAGDTVDVHVEYKESTGGLTLFTFKPNVPQAHQVQFASADVLREARVRAPQSVDNEAKRAIRYTDSCDAGGSTTRLNRKFRKINPDQNNRCSNGAAAFDDDGSLIAIFDNEKRNEALELTPSWTPITAEVIAKLKQ